MKKGKNFLLLTGIACALALSSCGSKPSYELTIDKDEGVNQVTLYDGETVFSNLENVEEGKELRAVIDLKDDYEITAVKLDGDPINVTDGSYVFTMPSKNATLSVKTAEIINAYALTLDYDSGVASAKVYKDNSEVTNLSEIDEGSELTLKVTLNNKFKIKEVKLGETLLTENNGEYAFTMPSKNETITIATEEIIYAYTLDLQLDSGVKSAKVYLNNDEEVTDLSKINEGTPLYLVVEVNEYYGLNEVLLGETPLTEEDGKFNFVMPSKNETLKVTTALLTGKATVINDEAKGSYVLKVNGEASSEGNYHFGDTLSLEVAPNDGYKVANVLVNESPVSLTENVYEFEASLASYTIEITYDQLYSVTYKELSTPGSGFISESKILVNDVLYTEGDTIAEGDSVKVVLTAANASYNFQNNAKYFYLHVNNDVYHGDDEGNATLSKDFNTLTFNFVMPSNDVNLFLAYNSSRTDESNTSAISIEVEENDHLSFYGYSSNDLYNKNGFAPTIVRDPGYVISKIIINYEDGTSETLDQARYFPTFVNDVSQNWRYGATLKGNAKFTFVGEVHKVSTINYVGVENVKASYGNFSTSGVAGETISVNGITCTDPNKVISNIEVTGNVGNLSVNGYNDSWSYSFVMPENDVTISFIFEDLVPLTYEENEHITSVVFRKYDNSYSETCTYAKAGATVYAFVTVENGYVLGQAIDQDGNRYDLGQYSSSYAVVVGEKGLHLTFEVNIAYTVSVQPVSTQYVRTTINGSTQVIEGATVNFTYSLTDSKKVINKVYLANEDGITIEGVDITTTPNGSYTNCSFVMPAENVVICYDIGNNESYNVDLTFDFNDGATNSTITRFSLYNDNVNYYNFPGNVECEFYKGTQIRVSAGLVRGYKITATYSYLNENSETQVETLEVYSVSNSNTTFNELTVPANLTSIDFVISADTPIKYTVTHDESITDEEFASLEYQIVVSGKALAEGDNLYVGDSVQVNFITSVEGYQYQYVITNAEGATLSTGQPIDSDITITFKKVAAYTFRIVNNLPNYGSVSTTLSLSDNSNYYYNTTIYASGLTGTINMIAYTSYDVDYVLTIGGEVVESGVLPGNYSYTQVKTNTFNVNGNIVITYTQRVSE